jgi:hypothetical protein
MTMPETSRSLLRHMLATIAYRGGKATRYAPTDFGTFRAHGAMNTPVMLLAHIGDLIEWAHRWCRGDQQYKISEPLAWNEEVRRFHDCLQKFDQFLISGEPVQADLETLFQAPLADVLTHIGQISLLRRLAGDPVLGEAYRMAEIVPGRVGPEQAKSVQEFKLDKGAIWRAKQA